jgi:hypothetical protein
MKTLLATLVTLASIVSSAAVLQDDTTSSYKNKEGVKIPQTASATVPSEKNEKDKDGKVVPEDVKVTLLGSGVRKKSFLNIKVYLAEVFADNAAAFVPKKGQALDSLDASKVVAIRAVFLRDVDSETIMNAFKDGFGANHIDTKTGPIKSFLDAVSAGRDGQSGKALTFVISKNDDGTETLIYEDSKGTAVTIPGQAGLTKQIAALWLGNMVDGKAQDMQNEILSGK